MRDREAEGDPIEAVALLEEPKRRQLYDVVAASPSPVGRDEAAAAAGISRELAAFHLDRMAAAGLLATEYRRLGNRRGPGAGRPAKLYRRADREISVSLPARDYERAAQFFADALDQLDHTGVDAAAGAARVRGREAGAGARRLAGPRPSHQRLLGTLVDLLGASGYEPRVSEDGESVRLGNCPYHALAVAHRDLTCGMNLAWAEGILDGLGDGELSAELAPTPGYCCVRLSHTAGTSRDAAAEGSPEPD